MQIHLPNFWAEIQYLTVSQCQIKCSKILLCKSRKFPVQRSSCFWTSNYQKHGLKGSTSSAQNRFTLPYSSSFIEEIAICRTKAPVVNSPLCPFHPDWLHTALPVVLTNFQFFFPFEASDLQNNNSQTDKLTVITSNNCQNTTKSVLWSFAEFCWDNTCSSLSVHDWTGQKSLQQDKTWTISTVH